MLLAIESIPEGCVATYGQIARIVGTGPRQVAQAFAGCSFKECRSDIGPGSLLAFHCMLRTFEILNTRCKRLLDKHMCVYPFLYI